jgi:hypothetical protein
MSTHWGYRCEMCGTDSDHWYNHGDGDLAEIYHQWPKLRGIHDLFLTAHWRLQLQCGDAYAAEVLNFLAAHDGHEIVLSNEYGNVKPIPPPKVNPEWSDYVERAKRGSLSAARLLEDEIERRGLHGPYIGALLTEMGQPHTYHPSIEIDIKWALLRATPEQRARAFLAVME